MIGIDTSRVPPWRYFDDVVLTAEEQIEFIDFVERSGGLFYGDGNSDARVRAWREAQKSIHGLHYGNQGDAERISEAMDVGWIEMGQVFGRRWFAVPRS